ncbi:MAG: hypothetical protein AAB550_02350 [Patescibacteria group bacterium]
MNKVEPLITSQSGNLWPTSVNKVVLPDPFIPPIKFMVSLLVLI